MSDLMKQIDLGEMKEENKIIEKQPIQESIKDIDTTEGNWVELEENDLVNMFADYILYNQNEFQNQLKKEDFNYEVFDTDYYAEKFPHFSEEVHEILAKVSKEKIIDLRKQNEFFKEKKDINMNPFSEK